MAVPSQVQEQSVINGEPEKRGKEVQKKSCQNLGLQRSKGTLRNQPTSTKKPHEERKEEGLKSQ